MTLKVSVPTIEFDKFKYVIEVIFDEMLGVSCQVYSAEESDSIEFFCEGSSKRLNLSNVFLAAPIKGFPVECLPKLPLQYVHVEFLEPDIKIPSFPILFGNSDISIDCNTIKLGVDLLGGIFYTLSRFEEIAISARDEFGRFPASESRAYKGEILDRPIVDEYVDYLWACLSHLWPHLRRKKSVGRVCVTCDVDQAYDSSVANSRILARTCIGDIVKRKSISTAAKRIRRYVYNRWGNYRFDPFYSFDWYMDACESKGLKATFYFIPTSIEPNNGNYELTDAGIERLLREIDRRGHEIGVHGSYQSYLDGSLIAGQKKLLENTLVRLGIEQKIRGNRQHYLRWDAAVTPELIDQAGFEYDSSGGFADQAGFRYGTAKEFSMWGWQSDRKLKLKQRPLIAMESTLFEDCYMGLGKGIECLNYLSELNSKSKRYGGNFTLLWHNSSLTTKEEKALFVECIGNAHVHA